ncbi:MAG TPA: hypothetical protein PK205_16495 [Promineifilum sp.]|uniref:hypothetical protein n=1 Tax=Thauera sp. TaxID=1905334 RepID=UPI002CEFC8E8|nr:hypothetical protein [Thauera sp.]HRP25452.1 hypothetical protein [Thauera sp.]HRQ14904.1 hypothetical protein [Promineifilum sp.]
MQHLVFHRTLAALATSVLVSGCATEAISPLQARDVPKERHHSTPTVTSKNPARAVVVRDTGLYGSGLNVHFSINGERTATFSTGERLAVTLDPGIYIFGVLQSVTLGSVQEKNIETRLEPGATYYYRIMIEDQTGTSIQRYFPSAISTHAGQSPAAPD